MGVCEEICNRRLIRQLENEIGTSLVLYTADGFAFYATLIRVDDHRIARLGPGTGKSNVIVLTPGGVTEDEEFSQVDLSCVVAKAVNVTCNPLGEPD